MKRRIMLVLWLLIPVAVAAYHYGPGQADLARRDAAGLVRQAEAAEAAGRWQRAVELYSAAMAALPADEELRRHELQLARSKARIYTGELPEAVFDMDQLLSELIAGKAPQRLVNETRGLLAMGHYYAAWLMRLEGATEEEWLPEAEQARQHFRLLAEKAGDDGNGKLESDHLKNLEATIRLERMDLSELEALPLPKECQGCKNCSQKRRQQRESQSKKPGEKKPEDARNAGAGQRPEGSGS